MKGKKGNDEADNFNVVSNSSGVVRGMRENCLRRWLGRRAQFLGFASRNAPPIENWSNRDLLLKAPDDVCADAPSKGGLSHHLFCLFSPPHRADIR